MASLTLDGFQLAAALGALQGLIIAAILFTLRRNRTANRLLATLMLAFSAYLASSVYYEAGLIEVFPHFFGVSYQMPWLFGPLTFLYALAASDRDWRFLPKHLLHFIPAAVSVLVSMPYLLMSGPEKVALLARFEAGDIPDALRVIDPFKYVVGVGYSVATVVYLRMHRRRIEESYSNTGRVNLLWLLWLAGSAVVVWLAATLLGTSVFEGVLSDKHVTLAVAILVYSIGYKGLKQPEIFRYETAEYPVPPELQVAPVNDHVAESHAVVPRYERSGLGAQEAEGVEQSLLEVMRREAPWKDCDLTLADLAGRVGSTPHKLSEVLNSRIGQSFHDFVNAYRVRHVQQRIEAGDTRTLTMTALAFDAGFASKSTFNQAFKKLTNRTPSEYRAQLAQLGSDSN